jgi:2-polyprenyl-3-methyl-5-hydroxy-6-metoxy-1,4-benzoquinol methylase
VKTCDLNVDTLPWDDDFFDVIICSEIIEHIFDTDRLLEQIKRVLKPSGTLIISTPNLASFFNRLFILFGYQPVGTEVSCVNTRYGNRFRKALRPAGHIRNFTYAAFVDIIKAHGFKIEKISFNPMSESGIAAVIESVTGTIRASLGSVIIVKCMKGVPS